MICLFISSPVDHGVWSFIFPDICINGFFYDESSGITHGSTFLFGYLLNPLLEFWRNPNCDAFCFCVTHCLTMIISGEDCKTSRILRNFEKKLDWLRMADNVMQYG